MLKILNHHSGINKAIAFSVSTMTICTSVNLANFASAKPQPIYQPYNSQSYDYPVRSVSNRSKYPTTSQKQNSPRRQYDNQYNNYLSLPIGTNIPVVYEEAEKILVTKDESLAITVTVSNNIRNNYGEIVIPRGSQIEGQIQPDTNGSRFVARTLLLPNQVQIPIAASSNEITRTETVEAGKNTDAIWQGAVAGAAAATIIAAVTGDTAIATEEVIGGAGFGALAGFLFGGNNKKELISINTQTDLDLILSSNLVY